MRIQMGGQCVAVGNDPFITVCVQNQRDLPALVQIAHVDGPVHQLIHNQIKVFLLIDIAFDQIITIGIDAVKTYDHILAIHIDADLRIDGHVD